MRVLLLLSLFFILPFNAAVNLTAVGISAYYPFIKAWADAYSLLAPDFHLNFEPSVSAAAGTAQIANGTNGNKTIDLVIGASTPTAVQYKVGLQAVPSFISTIVPQINIGLQQDIVLPGSVLADIFMGNIVNWSHPNITSKNPGISFPNATIQVFYRSDITASTTLWTNFLSHRSSVWNATYGTTINWPSALKAKPNFVGYSNLLALNGAVAAISNSISYVLYYAVARDTGLHYVNLNNYYSHIRTTPATLASASCKLNALLEGVALIDPPDDNMSWPIVASSSLVISSTPTDCKRARELYKFLYWSLTSDFARRTTTNLGCIPLNQNLTSYTIAALQKIKCNGQSIGANESISVRDPGEYIIFVISMIVLALALIVSSLHIYNFRTSSILLIYTTVFVVGTILTLASPIFWWIYPTHTSICQARIWTLSLGISIMLGTMFSRTWQLQEIYYIQKEGFNGLTKRTGTNKTYIQLASTLFGVVFVNLIILIIWSAVDPMSSTFIVNDQIDLTGYWACQSHHILPWLIIQLLFFLFLLCFGVYVIYNTWSFQRAVVLTETRWVLFALYNVILNICAIVPFLSVVELTDRVLTFIVIASIDLSAGSIACAMLLPRVLENFKWSHANNSNKSGRKETTNSGAETMKSKGKREETSLDEREHRIGSIHQQRRSQSGAPEELAKKVEEPHPLDASASERFLDPVNETLNLSSDQSSHPFITDNGECASLPRLSEHPAETDIDSPLEDPSSSEHPLSSSVQMVEMQYVV